MNQKQLLVYNNGVIDALRQRIFKDACYKHLWMWDYFPDYYAGWRWGTNYRRNNDVEKSHKQEVPRP